MGGDVSKPIDSIPIGGMDKVMISPGDQIVACSTQGNLNTGTYLGVTVVEKSTTHYRAYPGQEWVKFRAYYMSDGRKRYINEYGWYPIGGQLATGRMIRR
jgi:hypothetical protein